jgi:hypothetical protein
VISAAKLNGSEIKDVPSWLRGVATDCEKEGLFGAIGESTKSAESLSREDEDEDEVEKGRVG